MPDSYRAPGWFTRNVFNQLVAFLTRQGVSVLGSRVLAVKGRTTGQWRTTPVNLLTFDGHRPCVLVEGAALPDRGIGADINGYRARLVANAGAALPIQAIKRRKHRAPP